MTDLELCLAYRQGDRQAGATLIERHQGLVRSIVRRRRRRGVLDEDDLVQEGCMGLLRAAELFDPTKGASFATHAHKHAWARVHRAIQDQAEVVRVPVRLQDQGHLLPASRSLNAALYDGTETAQDRLPSLYPSPEDDADASALRGYLQAHLDRLPRAQREAVIARFGLNGEPPMEYPAIARLWGCSRQNIQARVEMALATLRLRVKPDAAA